MEKGSPCNACLYHGYEGCQLPDKHNTEVVQHAFKNGASHVNAVHKQQLAYMAALQHMGVQMQQTENKT